MSKAMLAVCMLGFGLLGFAQDMPKKGGTPDKALMQKIWDGWSTLDPANTAPFYAKGPHVFFDIAPLKYNSWDEYEAGVKKELAGYNSAKFTVNDDAQIHPAGQIAWGTATIKFDMMEKSGKDDRGDMRWTVVWQKEGGKWLIVHEHVSVPMQ
ncbi:MAG: nuclear transport factor 2 family protein [Acidobacteriaceae bacterium]|nr:nuclear transport factor 2 family protein [Acidobacteriaceae bacterium]